MDSDPLIFERYAADGIRLEAVDAIAEKLAFEHQSYPVQSLLID
ncbi:hypothetical protein [Mycolicibacterium neoaurum]|nr:hypothetical protein [Mycolicibacterium neoaurum]